MVIVGKGVNDMLDIDTAIKHCLEVAEQNETQAEKWQEEGGEEWGKTTACRECAADHRQLAEWLSELKELRNSVGAVKLELLKEAQAELEKRGNMLHDAIAELEEAKQILKMAVEDLSKMPCNNDTHTPDSCYICVKHGNCSYTDSFKWCMADIALKLIGETNDEP